MTERYAPYTHETSHSRSTHLETVLRHYITDPSASWGLGTFGAVAEFHHTSDEPVHINADTALHVVTARGALRINLTEDVQVCAYELPAAGDRWSHVLTLCLPAAHAAMYRRTVVTACGPDHEALRPRDRTADLFDLGLGTEAASDAVRRVPRSYSETALMLGIAPRALAWRVYLPAALPGIITGLRLGISLAWMVVMVGELTGVDRGIGAMMTAARESGRLDVVIIGMVTLGGCGALSDWVLRQVCRPATRWAER